MLLNPTSRSHPIDVSVVLAVKNEEIYIEAAIKSIAFQQGVATEIIVVDDGSDDATFAIVERLRAQLSNLHLSRNPGQGKCSAFNDGVARARGRFVCLFAGDDIMPEGSLAARYAAVARIDAAQPVVGLCKLVTMSDSKKFDGHLVPRKPGKGALSGVSYLMNAPAIARLFPVPEHLPNEDTWLELAVTFLQGFNLVHTDIVGCAWRVHSGNSINMMVGFDEFNNRYTQRMQAFDLLYNRHASELTPDGRKRLRGLVICEEKRRAGDVIGVVLSPVGLVAKLRALSFVNRPLYATRKKLYGLLSGW